MASKYKTKSRAYHSPGRPPWPPRKIMFYQFNLRPPWLLLDLRYNALLDGIVTSLGAPHVFQSMQDEPARGHASTAPHVQNRPNAEFLHHVRPYRGGDPHVIEFSKATKVSFVASPAVKFTFDTGFFLLRGADGGEGGGPSLWNEKSVRRIDGKP